MHIAAFFAFVATIFYPKQAKNALDTVVASAQNVMGPFLPTGPQFWNAQKVYAAAHEIRASFGLRADPLMIAAMAQIESSFNPYATRYETHLKDASHGLMQTMLKTAQWLWDDMGYKAFARPTETTLKNGRTSLYFGMAYVDYLSRYRGTLRSEQWIVESYNGGPGNSNSMTQNHWRKYINAKGQISRSIGVA